MPRAISGDDSLSLTAFEGIVRACDRFEAAWRQGRGPRIEEFLTESPTPQGGTLLRELVALEVELRKARGETPVAPEYRDRFPEHAALIEALFEGPRTEPLGAETTLSGEKVPKIPSLPLRGNDRYEFVEFLGRGGMGIVYRAYDRRRREFIAIKTLRSFSPALLDRFKREFRSLANVTHPNLVSLYELTSDGQTWSFSMELIDGVDLISHINGGAARDATAGDRASTWSGLLADPSTDLGVGASRVSAREREPDPHPQTGPTSRSASESGSGTADREAWVERLRGAMAQLAWGVSALHAAGKLHRDIKPSNVLVDRGGRVVLLDFGLAAEVEGTDSEQSSEPRALGTAAYMAPEQGAGRAVSTASDWYCVGAMLYEALTGRLPFTGGALEILIEKQRSDPPPPNSLVPGLPEDLATLCIDLLRRDPEARPPGPEVVRRLGGHAEEQDNHLDAPARPATGPGIPLIGRTEHLKALDAGFAAACRGRTVVLLFHGRSGIGKSALMKHFLDGLRARGGSVILAGRCYEQELVPYKALDMCIDSLSRYLRRLPMREAQALLPRDVLPLAQVFPVLLQSEAVATAPRRAVAIPDPHELRRRTFAALRELLARIGDRRPLVLAIDDLQWGDLDSASALAEVLRAPDAPPLLFLGCYRSEDTEASPFLRALPDWRAELDESGVWRDLTVEALTPAEARDFTRSLLELEGNAAAERADVIARESGGSPLFITELVRQLPPEAGPPDRPLTVREISLDEMLWARIDRLPEAARRVLEVVAVAGRPMAFDEACRAAELGPEDRAAPAQLRAGRLLRGTGAEGGGEVETYHDRVRETILAHLPPEALRVHHGRLARTLEASQPTDFEVLAVHYHGAGEPARAGELYARAADHAAGALAFDRAAQLYRLALGLRPAEDGDDRPLRSRLGDALANAGRGDEAAREYLRAAGAGMGDETIELARRAATQFLISGHIDEGLAVLRGVLESAGMRLPDTPRGALRSLLYHRAWVRLRGVGFRPRDASRVAARDLWKLDIAWSGASGLLFTDWIRGVDFHTRYLLLALKAGEPFHLARALATEAAASALAGWEARRRTARLLGVATSLAQAVDHPYVHAIVAACSGLAAYLEGRWKDAVAGMDHAEQLYRERCTGVAWELDSVHAYFVWALARMGQVAELGRRLPMLLREARERRDLFAIANLSTYATTMVRLADDDPDGAARESRGAMAQWSRGGFHLQHRYAVLGNTYIELYGGGGRAAWDYLSEIWPAYRRSLLKRTQVIRIDMLNLRALCALAAATEPTPAAFLRSAAADARRLESEGAPLAYAHARSIEAALAAARGDQEAAAGLTSEAAVLFDAVDMGLHASVLRYRLGRLIGGQRGRELTEGATRWMEGQGVRRPDRMTAAFAPGIWPEA
jgi:serine/threonine protein kinase